MGVTFVLFYVKTEDILSTTTLYCLSCQWFFVVWLTTLTLLARMFGLVKHFINSRTM